MTVQSDTQTVDMSINFTGHGWADLEIKIGEDKLDIPGFSDTTDALHDFLRAGLMAVLDQHRFEFSLDGEPQEWRWIIENYWDQEKHMKAFRVRVLTFRDYYIQEPEENGMVLLDAHCDPEAFATETYRMCKGLWDELGADGYSKLWFATKAFPLRALKSLEAALAVQDPVPKKLEPKEIPGT